MSTTSTVTITFIAGVVVGAALGILLAPASGKETREKLMKKGGQIRDTVSDMVDDAKKMATDATETVRNVRDTASQAASATGYGSQQRSTGSSART